MGQRGQRQEKWRHKAILVCPRIQKTGQRLEYKWDKEDKEKIAQKTSKQKKTCIASRKQEKKIVLDTLKPSAMARFFK